MDRKDVHIHTKSTMKHQGIMPAIRARLHGAWLLFVSGIGKLENTNGWRGTFEESCALWGTAPVAWCVSGSRKHTEQNGHQQQGLSVPAEYFSPTGK